MPKSQEKGEQKIKINIFLKIIINKNGNKDIQKHLKHGDKKIEEKKS